MGEGTTNLPFPDSRSGWSTAIITTLLLFLIFYTIGYPCLEGLYNNQSKRSNDVVNYTDEDIHIRVQVEVPQYVSSFVDRDLGIWLENLSDQPVEMKIKILTYVVNQTPKPNVPYPVDASIATGVLVSSQVENNIIQNGTDIVNFGTIPQKARVFKSVRFRLPESQNGEKIRFRFMADNGSNIHLINISDISSITHNPSSIIIELMKSILLPPLSNGLIPLVALFSAFSLDEVLNDKTKDNRRHAREAIFLRAFFILVNMSFVLYFYLGLVNRSVNGHGFYLILLVFLCHILACLLVRFTQYWAETDDHTYFRTVPDCAGHVKRDVRLVLRRYFPA